MISYPGTILIRLGKFKTEKEDQITGIKKSIIPGLLFFFSIIWPTAILYDKKMCFSGHVEYSAMKKGKILDVLVCRFL